MEMSKPIMDMIDHKKLYGPYSVIGSWKCFKCT